ncbi:protein OBERON 4-like [Canna indica]|uniref:Protein OBERON 4-like n=1 Tax=Canna indica TaxID=4628 RepID=A0AAQ3KB82_9LILI|nr:protein OBERON 4-like [Canna indica]
MKRPRSAPYGEDFGDDGDGDEKLSFKDWPRRSQDPDRSLSSSSHRRTSYSKVEGSRKVLSSYDRQLDDDWEPSRHLRRRYDHEPEAYDWRKGYDRYRDGRDGRDGGDRLMQVSSPRGSYGVDHRMHRSESFSGLRREFPKGFRSERDRSRREGSGSWSWWRSRSSKELSAEEVRKSPSIDSDTVGRRSHAASPDDHRGKVRSKDSSGMQARRAEAKTTKTHNLIRESGNSSEMEEGELEPEPEPEIAAEPSIGSKETAELESDNCKDRDPEFFSLPKGDLEKKGTFPGVKKSSFDDNVPVDVNEENCMDSDSQHTTPEGNYELKEIILDGNKLDVDGNSPNDMKAEKNLTEAILDSENMSNEVTDDRCDAVEDLHENDKSTEAIMDLGNTNNEVKNDHDDARIEHDESFKEEGKPKSADREKEVEGEFCGEKGNPIVKLDESGKEGEGEATIRNGDNEMEVKFCGEKSDAFKELEESRSEGKEVKNGNADNELEGEFSGKKHKVSEKNSSCSQFEGEKLKGNDLHQGVEVTEIPSDISPSQADILVENKVETQCNDAKVEVEQNYDMGNHRSLESEVEVQQEHEPCRDLEVVQEEKRDIDLETEPEGTIMSSDQDKEVACETKREAVTLALMRDTTKENYKDKGKGLAISFSPKVDSLEDDDAMKGPSGRGFELDFRLNTSQTEIVRSSGIVTWSVEHEKLKVEPLDLSLALPGGLSDNLLKHSKPKPEISSCARSIQSLPSSFRTNSDGLTTSISFASSQHLVHNPSCSLTQNSLDNYEHSVGSRPIFQPVDQVSTGAIWQAQTSNDSKRKGSIPHFQRVLLNGNSSQNSLHAMEGQRQSKSNDLIRQSSFSRQMSPTNSHGSRDTRSQQTKDKRLLTRERSSSSLCRTEQRDGEQLVLNGFGVTEKIVSKILAEPLHLSGRMLQEMTDHSVAYLRKTISEMLTNTDKSRQLHEYQEALKRRSDMTMDALMNCPRVLLEILVAIKTGSADFISRVNNLTSSDLVEIFLNLKCQNLSCRSLLPVEDCDCKICLEKPGFCSACTCLVCSKFDNALNTCSWVGCDLCLHWCHTDCGLRDSHIRNGCSASGEGTTEMQFHCVACGHPSEMFGFVKEVFKTCAKNWKAETLSKELQYVRRIFSTSNDVRGKRLYNLTDEMLLNLEKETNHCEVVSHILAFLSENVSYISSCPSVYMHKESSGNEAGQSSKKEWLPSFPSEKSSLLGNTGLVSSMDCDQMGRKAREIELQMGLEKKPVADELDSVIKFKLAEAKMYQERADDARREAENLKHIAMAKNSKIDEDYASRIEKIQVVEAEERRKRKLDELQVIERAHREYFSMKMRMESDIKDLLLKMETTRRNLNT